jgi:hypothetical protein
MVARIAVPILALAGAAPALAHHSFAPHFDAERPVDISGAVLDYEARNPHSYLHVSAVDENGRSHEYVCESHGVTQLSRTGLTPAMLTPGTKVRVVGSQSRHDPYMCFFNSVQFADGRTIDVNGPARAPGSAQPAVGERHDIFGRWLLAPASRATSGPQPMLDFLTPAGEKAVAAYDPFKDDPTFRCDPVAIRRVWGAPGTPLEIIREKDRVILRHEWMDVERVIDLAAKQHPAGAAKSSLGHSIGHFEGDTLVIETANYPPGVLSQYVEQPGKPTRGMLHSAALTSVERLHLDAQRQRLVVEIDLADPEFFTRPFPTATYEYAPTALMLEPFRCSPENVNGSVRR